MSFYFLDSSARSAWLAATTQQTQLEALAALWSGDVWAKFYSSAGTHLATVTYGTPTIDTGTTPRAMVLGAWSAETHYNPGTATYCILQIPSGADILRADSTWDAADPTISDPGGRVRVDIGTKLRLDATASLPAGAEPGTVTTIGTQSLYDYLGDVRTALPEGLAAADARMQVRTGALAYCGASTIWRGKFAIPILGGHGDSFDDGGYAQNLSTGAWETLIAPSTYGSSATLIDASGEWVGGTSGRPASRHTLQYLVTVGDDLISAIGCYVGVQPNSSRQAHRWNYSTGLWQRYGGGNAEGHVSPSNGAYAHYDSVRNRIVRIEYAQADGRIDTIPADNADGSWTAVTVSAPGRITTTSSAQIGYHEALDCYVIIDPAGFSPRNTMYVMDPDALTTGWVSVSVSGDVPPLRGETGLEYCPPLGAMATVDPTVADRLYYITPTGAMTDPWVWSHEDFTGGTQTWDGYPSGDYNGVYRRFVWSSALGGFVMLKKSTALTELYTPTT